MGYDFFVLQHIARPGLAACSGQKHSLGLAFPAWIALFNWQRVGD